MKEELQLKLVEILGSIQTAAGKAGDFAMAQLPDIAQSYVVYGRAYHSLMVVISLVVASVSIAMVLYGRQKYNDGETKYQKDFPGDKYRILHRDNYSMGLPYFGIAAASGLIGTLMFLGNFGAALMVWFAPKVWLLKELANMVR